MCVLYRRGGIKITANQTSSCQHQLSKKLVPDWIFLKEVHTCYNRYKNIYTRDLTRVLVLVRELAHS